MAKKVLITAAEVHPIIPEGLLEMGFEVEISPDISRAELLQNINKYEGLIFATYTIVDCELLDAASQLKFAGRVGSGLENADVAYAASKGIAIINSPEGNANAVGEHSLGLLLSVMNNISRGQRELLNGQWQREANRGEELDGKKVGIIGFGHTGSAFAKKLRGFDVKVLAYDKYKTGFGNEFVKESTLEEIQEKADVISFHVPYSNEIHHWVNENFMLRCHQKPYLINTSRGEVFNTSDVLLALKKGSIRGLGIDVYEDEPPSKGIKNNPSLYLELFEHPKVVATPHIAGWTKESKELLATVLMDKIRKQYTDGHLG